MIRLPTIAAVLAAMLAAVPSVPAAAPDDPFFGGDIDGEAIRYGKTPVEDDVTRLAEAIEAGRIDLDRGSASRRLEALLEAMDMDPASQVLVFSKTSLQQRLIDPRSPRAIYFDDDTYVGFVRGGDVIEILEAGGPQGSIFYTIPAYGSRSVVPRRDDSCLLCHSGRRSLSVPGPFVRSIFPDADGNPLAAGGAFTTTHRSPLARRWGGWYVTGRHGEQRHMGNAVVPDIDRADVLDTSVSLNRTDLSDRFNTSAYLRPTSDIAALMVLEHQVHMQNLLTMAAFETRDALHAQRVLDEALDRPGDEWSDTTRRRIERAADAVLRYMLMVDEVILEDPIEGTSGFAEHFSKRGPFDRQGRTLRQLDLRHYLFRYPLSYMVHSPAFRTLPDPLMDHLAARLGRILRNEEPGRPWNGISKAKKRAILEILGDTEPDLYRRMR